MTWNLEKQLWVLEKKELFSPRRPLTMGVCASVHSSFPIAERRQEMEILQKGLLACEGAGQSFQDPSQVQLPSFFVRSWGSLVLALSWTRGFLHTLWAATFGCGPTQPSLSPHRSCCRLCVRRREGGVKSVAKGRSLINKATVECVEANFTQLSSQVAHIGHHLTQVKWLLNYLSREWQVYKSQWNREMLEVASVCHSEHVPLIFPFRR